MLTNPADILSIMLRGALGRSGRKRARRATRFLTGQRGFLTASSVMAAAGVAWGIYDSVRGANVPSGGAAAGGVMPPPGPAGAVVPAAAAIGFGASSPAPAAGGSPGVGHPPVPSAPDPLPDPVARLIRLAVSAARADGQLSDQERALILRRAQEAGLEASVEAELTTVRPLADIVLGVTDPTMKRELYVLAFAIVRADETVTGAERIYLAQLAHQLGLEAAAVAAIELETAAKIDAEDDRD